MALAAVSVLVYQGALSLGATLFEDALKGEALAALTSAGGVLIIGISLKLLDVTDVKVGNFLARLPVRARAWWASSPCSANSRTCRYQRGAWPHPPRPLTIWPVEDGRFGIDVRWGGGQGNRRGGSQPAERLRHQGEAGPIDGRARLGASRRPLPGDDVARVIDAFIW